MSLFGSSINPPHTACSRGFSFGAPANSGGFGSSGGNDAAPACGCGFSFGAPAKSGGYGFSPDLAFGDSTAPFRSSARIDNASEPFGRVESTQRCFARIGEVAVASKWTPPKPPSRPLFSSAQTTSLFCSSPREPRSGAVLFGFSAPQTQSQFGSGSSGGSQPTVSGGFTFGCSTATTPSTAFVCGDGCFGVSSAGIKPTSFFGGSSLSHSTGSSGFNSGFGGTGTVFGSGSTPKPPLAPSSKSPFAASTSNPFAKSTASPFAPTQPVHPVGGSSVTLLGPSSSNPFATTNSVVSTSNPFARTPGSNANSFADLVASSSNVNPFAPRVPSLTGNPYASKNAMANTFASTSGPKKNPFATPGSTWSTGWSTNSSWKASTKFKSGLRPAFKMIASPFGSTSTHPQHTSEQTQPPLITGFDWTGREKKAWSTQPDVEKSECVAEVKTGSSNYLASTTETSSPSDMLVASPDSNPYGSGSFGAGLVEQMVKTAITNPPSSVERKILDDHRSSAEQMSAMPRQQTSARFAARLGLARQPLRALPMRPVHPRFPSRRHPTAVSSIRGKLPQADAFHFSSSFSRLAISKRALRVRVEPSTMSVNTTTASSKKTESVEEDAEASGDVLPPTGDDGDEESVEKDDSENHPARAPPSHVCPVLLNHEYFTMPTVDELQKLSDEELSHVENFAIGRHGCGKISFVGAMDVRGLQLDELVAFSEGEVMVYPDDHLKPDVGFGLNKPAIVDLNGIYSEENESHEDFLKRLEIHTQALGATFLAYDEDLQVGKGGVWSFRVEHF